jgi:hypothetical protein
MIAEEELILACTSTRSRFEMLDSRSSGFRCWKLLSLLKLSYGSLQNFDDPSGHRRLQGSSPMPLPPNEQSSAAFS